MDSVTQYVDVHWSLYACPQTGVLLQRAGEVLQSSENDVQYPIRYGIPHFLKYGPVESLEVAEQLEQLNGRARSVGWKEALGQTYGTSSNIYRYTTDQVRAVYLDVLPLTADSVVLEIGPGLGQFTGLIAARARHVYALEVVSGQARFAAERCRQMGLSNVTVACGGDDCRLPYIPEAFDVVVLNLVFEWCASRDSDEQPIDGQLRLLAEINRVLKPGGWLYLATKNRYALQYLVGKGDEHAYGLRFGNALPRWLMAALLKMTGHDRPGGLLHSHNALQKMIRNSGFEKVRSYWAAPEMRYPQRIVATDSHSIQMARREGLVQGGTRLTRAIMPRIPAQFVKHFTPGLTFLAQKNGAKDQRCMLE